MTYTFGRQAPTGYYTYLNRKGTLIIGRQTFDGRCNIFSGTYGEAKERGLINRLAFEAPRIHRNIAEHYEDWPEISRPKVENRIIGFNDWFEGLEEANRNGWELMSTRERQFVVGLGDHVRPFDYDLGPHDKVYSQYSYVLRRVPRDINTDKVIYEED